jgi:hypothetical protein
MVRVDMYYVQPYPFCSGYPSSVFKKIGTECDVIVAVGRMICPESVIAGYIQRKDDVSLSKGNYPTGTPVPVPS